MTQPHQHCNNEEICRRYCPAHHGHDPCAWEQRHLTACGFDTRSRPHIPTPDPCEEQGCTDTENCDEICEHSRIYSPAWVKEHDTAIRTEERSKILRLVESDEWQKEHDEQTRNATIKEIIDYISPDLTTGNVVAYLQFLRTQEHP